MSHQSIGTLALAATTVMVFLNIRGLTAFPSGAPPDACSTNLLPIHGGHQPSPGPAPYVLTASSNSYSSNKPINVVIKGLTGSVFKGFVVQAQDAISGEPINSGEWSSGSAKELPCAAATHMSPNSKPKVELTWTPKGSGQVQFVATVVESFDTFYANIKSIVRSADSSGATGTSHRHKPSRPNSNGHRDNAAQDNFPFDSPSSSFPASQPKDDSNRETLIFPSSSSFGSQGSPSFTVEDQDQVRGGGGDGQQNFFPHPSFRPQPGGSDPFSGGFHQGGFKPDDRQQEQESSSQVFPSFSGSNNNNMHRFAPPQEPPPPFMRAPWHLPHRLI